ncbi:hypothetical protein [Spirulina major]|nr:hypothetical protein [Spirulina major]
MATVAPTVAEILAVIKNALLQSIRLPTGMAGRVWGDGLTGVDTSVVC